VFAPLSVLGPAITLPGLPSMTRSYHASLHTARSLATRLSLTVGGLTALYTLALAAGGGAALTFLFGDRFASFTSLIVPVATGQLLAAASIGFIILLGLVVNAAILLVDQTRARERHGIPRKQAVREALETRARPIVLSTLTAVLGMAPLMFMPGLGAEIYRGLAAVVAGGMVIGTCFTWVLMPALLRLGEEKSAVTEVATRCRAVRHSRGRRFPESGTE
jgi:Cu/Ag efflux pump CusA